MSRAIVIQGPSTYVSQLKEAWKGFDIIWSTWVGEENKYMPDDVVIFNEKPTHTGVQNITLQHKTTIEGVRKAKELGYDRVLKWRSDMTPNNPEKLLETFKDNSLNFLAFHTAGYFVDYFLEGKTDDVYAVWDINIFYSEFSEKITTNNIYEKGYSDFNFIACFLDNNNDILWLKKDIRLSSYKNNTAFLSNTLK